MGTNLFRKWLGTDKVRRKKLNADISQLMTVQRFHLHDLELKANKHGWIIDTCDAMLWQGKYGAVTGKGNIRAANLWPDPGRFARKSTGACWENGEDHGAKATWSRDMGMGLIWWAWRTRDSEVLSDHILYGSNNKWKMGEPFADGRVMYTPNMIGLLYSAYDKLKKSNHIQANLGGVYASGLDDYEAHIAVMGILLKGEIDGFIWQRDLKIIEEQAERLPGSALYQSAKALYTGTYKKAVAVCLYPKVADYISTKDRETCFLIDTVFATDLLLRAH